MKPLICLLAATLLFYTGCSASENAPAPSSAPLEQAASSAPSAASSREASSSSLSSSSSEPQTTAKTDGKALLLACQEQYPDAAAWLQVPGTDINDCVMQGKDNTTYSRSTKEGTEIEHFDTNACLFLDYESLLGAGSRSDISQNTIIYGLNYGNWSEAAEKSGWKDHVHQAGEMAFQEIILQAPELYQATEAAAQDDPDAPGFSQLLRFADEAFAKEHPYLYLSTPAETLCFEIFMAGYTDAYTDPSYIYASYSEEDFTRLIQNMRAYSLYHYEREVAPATRILTLSTDTFHFPNMADKNGARARFVLMAALVEADGPFFESARMQINPSPKPLNLQPHSLTGEK